MAFEDIKLPVARKLIDKPFIRVAKRGSTVYGTLSVKTGFRGKKVQVQLDTENRKIRCRESDSGIAVNNNGVFFVSSEQLLVIGEERLLLVKEGEWWYGEY